ncbi:MAG TPA: hypothetical protein VG605_03880 [Puia sp.]|nr:hypothetical protein [Puia sp.]
MAFHPPATQPRRPRATPPEELYEKYADQNSGIPFFLIMAADGAVIADSRIKPAGAKPGSSGANIGYPGSKEEITYFMRVLHETTSLTTDQLKTIRAQLAKSSRPGF